jgi:hypothetical protein
MVSPQSTTETDSGSIRSDRLSQEVILPVTDRLVWERYSSSTGFWGSVIAGTLFALSVFALSWYLMLGCHVGVAGSRVFALGVGSAWWIVVTSCVAFYFGGMVASAIARPYGTGWVRGAAIWGLSIPLTLAILGLVAGREVLGALHLPHAGALVGTTSQITESGTAFAWVAFLTLICGLIFAMLGSFTCACARREKQ